MKNQKADFAMKELNRPWVGFKWGLLAAGLAVLAGCSLPTAPVQPATFDFGATAAQTSSVPVQSAATVLPALAVAEIDTSSALDSTAMLYRLNYLQAHQLQPYTLARRLLRGWGCAAGLTLWRSALCAHFAAMLVTGSRRGTRFARWCALRSNSHGEPVNEARTSAPTLSLRFSPPQRSPRRTAPAAKQGSWCANAGIPANLRRRVCAALARLDGAE
jgi:hypothetical protein